MRETTSVGVFCNPTSWYLRDLQRAGGDEFQVEQVPFTTLRSSVQGEGVNVSSGARALHGFDFLLTRTMPPGSLEQVVFRMNALAELAAAGTPVFNSPRATEISVDKYLATARLRAAGLTTPVTHACQTWEDALESFADLGGDVVVKPLFGGEGRGITRVADRAIAERVFKTLTQLNAVLYLQPFVPHAGEDWRVLRVGERFWGMRRINRADWRTNVSRGAESAPLEVTPELADIALRASDAVGAEIAGVDLLPAHDGQLYILEVNASPGWKALARAADVDIAREVLTWARAQAGRLRNDGE